LTTTTSQDPALWPERENRQVSDVVLLAGEEMYAVMLDSPDFMSTTDPWLEVRLKPVPVTVTYSEPLLYPSEGLILVIVGLAATGLTRATSRSTPARDAKKYECFMIFPSSCFIINYLIYSCEIIGSCPGGLPEPRQV